MRLIYMAVLGPLGFVLGSLVHPIVGIALAVGGVCFGWYMGVAGDAYRATLAAKAASDVAVLPAYKGIYKDLDIVGESFYQAAIRVLWVGPNKTFAGVLIPESTNSHDKNAVRVEVGGMLVGYLSRETAREYRNYMSAQRCKVPVHMVMGGAKDTIGVFMGRSSADNASLRAATRKTS
jgi:HIRAN domain